MNALVKKEIRLLLPSFLAGCVLAFSNLFLPRSSEGFNTIFYVLTFILCPAMGVMLALSSFGVEVSSGTFSNLLVQPVSRQKIWQIKVSALATHLLVMSILYSFALVLRLLIIYHTYPFNQWLDLFAPVTLFGLVTFSGGLWTVLLLRQVAAAFWFMLLIPGMLLVMVMGLFADHSDEFREGLLAIVLGGYSLAGFFFARWLFLRAQDVQWTGGAIVMPEIRGLARFKWAARARPLWRPRAALWRKEIQLHQSQFVIAFVLLVLHLAVLAVRKFHDLHNSHDLKFILEIFWGLWLAMPLLVGCAAVAEERKLGTLEGQLCLPVKRRTQFAIKLFVVLALSVFLGTVMPLLLEGTRILPDVHSIGFSFSTEAWRHISTAQIFIWICLGNLFYLLPLLALAAITLLTGAISFYVSTLTRNTLQSLTPAALGLMLAWFLLFAAGPRDLFDHDFLWLGPIPYFIALPMMLLTLLACAFWNFKHAHIGWKTGLANLLGFGAALVLGVALSSAVYHRAWEKLAPFEPPHGVARLSSSNPAQLNMQWGNLSVRLPDGKVWLARFNIPNPDPVDLMLGKIKATLKDGKTINQSNWSSVTRTADETVGIKTDGTLWVSERSPKGYPPHNDVGRNDQSETHQLMQFGQDTNWNSLVPLGHNVLLVKNDGTLWFWGTTNSFGRYQPWPGLQTFAPQRCGTESNWAEVDQKSQGQMFLRKTDGSLWTRAGNWNTNGHSFLTPAPGFTMESMNIGDHKQFRSVAQIWHGLQFEVGICTDGTFRIWAEERMTKETRGNYELFSTDVPIGNETNWVAVAGNGENIITLKNDGSIWRWNFHYDSRRGWSPDFFESEVKNTPPIRLGTHNDWIAISGIYENICTLAADGSLWYWPLVSAESFYNNGGNDAQPIPPLLDISRKPQFLGNVFGEVN